MIKKWAFWMNNNEMRRRTVSIGRKSWQWRNLKAKCIHFVEKARQFKRFYEKMSWNFNSFDDLNDTLEKKNMIIWMFIDKNVFFSARNHWKFNQKYFEEANTSQEWFHLHFSHQKILCTVQSLKFTHEIWIRILDLNIEHAWSLVIKCVMTLYLQKSHFLSIVHLESNLKCYRLMLHKEK